jgi:hypothetical protein
MCAYKTGNKKTQKKKKNEKPARNKTKQERTRREGSDGAVVWLCGSQNSFIFLLLPAYYLREKEKKNEMSNKWLIYLLMASHSPPAIAVAHSVCCVLCVVPRQVDLTHQHSTHSIINLNKRERKKIRSKRRNNKIKRRRRRRRRKGEKRGRRKDEEL